MTRELYSESGELAYVAVPRIQGGTPVALYDPALIQLTEWVAFEAPVLRTTGYHVDFAGHILRSGRAQYYVVRLGSVLHVRGLDIPVNVDAKYVPIELNVSV